MGHGNQHCRKREREDNWITPAATLAGGRGSLSHMTAMQYCERSPALSQVTHAHAHAHFNQWVDREGGPEHTQTDRQTDSFVPKN